MPCSLSHTNGVTPATNQNPNFTPLPNNIPANTREKVADVLKNWQHWAAEKAKWEKELELKKIALGGKTTEYEKSTGRQPEHPSVPEYQAKFRKKYEKDVASAEKHLAIAKAEFDRCASNLAVSLTQRMPLEIENLIQQLMDKSLEKQTAAVEAKSAAAASISDAELDRRIGDRINLAVQKETGRLCSKVDRLENRIVDLEGRPMHTELAADQALQAKMADYKNQQKQAFDALKQETLDRQRELALQQELIDKLTARTKALEDQITKLQKEKAAAQVQAQQEPPPPQAQPTAALDGKLTSWLDKLESTQATDREYHTEQNQLLNRELAILRDQVQQGKAVKKELDAIRFDTDRLKYRVDNLSRDIVPREDFTSLSSKFNNLELKTDETAAWQSQAKLDLAKIKPELEECSSTIKNHKARLARVDVDALEKIADAFDMEVPTMQANISELQKRVNQIDQAGKEAYQGFTEFKQLRAAQTLSPAPSYTGELPPLQSKLYELEAKAVQQEKWFAALMPRIREIKDSLAQEKQRVDDRFNELAASTTTRGLPVSATEVNSFRSKVENITGEFEKLQTSVKTLEQTVQDFGRQSDKVEYLNHQFLALDSQYQKLSTKKLMDSVVKQIQLLYPGTQQIQADVRLLSGRLEDCQLRLTRVEQNVQSSLRNSAQRTPVDSATGNKRRRTDEPGIAWSSPALNGARRMD
jgi:archaellum component FlaC